MPVIILGIGLALLALSASNKLYDIIYILKTDKSKMNISGNKNKR